MYKARFLVILLGLYWFCGQAHFLYAQDEGIYDDYGSMDDGWDGSTFTISFGVIFPTVFLDNGGNSIENNFKPPVGGAGSLAYNYVFPTPFFIGAEIGMKFYYTLGGNVAFIIPMGLRTGWQFSFRNFHFPLFIVTGVAPQRYLNNNYAGFFLKGGVSVFYYVPDWRWSFGVNADWSWYPQWPREDGRPVPSKNVDANMAGVTLSARYHF